MIRTLGLQDYPSDALLFLLGCACLLGFVVGYITDSVMGDRGFGAFGNGMLAVFGAFVGVYIRNTFFVRMHPGDIVWTGLFAAAAATLLLLMLGVVKSWVQR